MLLAEPGLSPISLWLTFFLFCALNCFWVGVFAIFVGLCGGGVVCWLFLVGFGGVFAFFVGFVWGGVE